MFIFAVFALFSKRITIKDTLKKRLVMNLLRYVLPCFTIYLSTVVSEAYKKYRIDGINTVIGDSVNLNRYWNRVNISA